MPRAAATLGFCVLLFISNIAAAAELTGFGPIKFGMSKEEALAVLSTRGLNVKEVTETDNETIIIYEIPFNNKSFEGFDYGPYSALRVTQVFENDRAGKTLVRSFNKNERKPQCDSLVDYFISIISTKYNIDPVVSSGDEIIHNYLFGFDQEAFIKLYAIKPISIRDAMCQIDIVYFPPPENPVGF